MKPPTLIRPASALPRPEIDADVRRPGEIDPALLSLANAGRYLDLSPLTLRNWMREGVVPFRPVPGMRKVLLVKADLDAWIESKVNR